MSRYCSVVTEINDLDALLASLVDMGWTMDQIEVHDEAQHLRGYQGDQRQELAHVIIRKHNVGRAVDYAGSASNDLGFFRKSDGTYAAIVSDYDKSIGFNDRWVGNLVGEYSYHRLSREMSRTGRTVRRQRLPNGRQQLRVEGYR